MALGTSAGATAPVSGIGLLPGGVPSAMGSAASLSWPFCPYAAQSCPPRRGTARQHGRAEAPARTPRGPPRAGWPASHAPTRAQIPGGVAGRLRSGAVGAGGAVKVDWLDGGSVFARVGDDPAPTPPRAAAPPKKAATKK